MAQQKHNQVVDFSNPNADKIKSASTANNIQQTEVTAGQTAYSQVAELVPQRN